MSSISIRALVSQILEGRIRVPAFQRGFVWDSDNVAFLMDSIYRGFPFGGFLFWRTREQLPKERELGPFLLPDRPEQMPVDYILDGQQRVTSLFGVFQTELEPGSQSGWRDIYFDFESTADQFVALQQSEVIEGRHFALRTFFDAPKFGRAARALDDEKAERIDEVQSRFRELLIPSQVIEPASRNEVAIIFERINRAGVNLSDYELLSAWTWSTEFDLRDSFEQLAADVSGYGFGEIDQDPNLLMKCVAAVVKGGANPGNIIDLDGPSVRQRFAEVRAGICGAIEFLKRELHVESLKIMPYPAMLVPLTVFFATTRTSGIHPDYEQSIVLQKWFWKCCFSRRYSSGVGRAHAIDIKEMENLRDDRRPNMVNINAEIDKSFFTSNKFTISTVNTKTFALLLAQKGPRSLLSGAVVNLAPALQVANRADFHHIFPDRFLERQGVARDSRNVLANFCFLSNADNQSIKDKAPSNYAGMLPEMDRHNILDSNLIPRDFSSLTFNAFVESRANKLVEYARSLMGVPGV